MLNLLRCKVCNVSVSSPSLLESHNKGKKHQKRLKAHFVAVDAIKQSVFICGLSPYGVTSEQVKTSLSIFGEVNRVLFDAGKGTSAIVEFVKEECAKLALNEGKIDISGHSATIKQRKTEFESSVKQCINVQLIISHLSSLESLYDKQIDKLIEMFCLNNVQLLERVDNVRRIEQALCEYFDSDLNIKLFGSSITSIGTIDSDIDITLCFGENPIWKICAVNEFERDKFTLMTCDSSLFFNRKITVDELARLNQADRVRLLTKILNDIRRRHIVPISDQYPILDARCPLVRFRYNRTQIFDLSINNRLGFTKSDWIRRIIQFDSSSTIRRFLIAIRFWALCNGLMKKDELERGNFNAYILNIMCILFLQTCGILGPILRSFSVVLTDDWNADFIIDSCHLSGVAVSDLIKEFFSWFIQLTIKDTILCPHFGRVLSLEEFRAYFPRDSVQDFFKLAFLNLQDPFELCHNITSLVSRKYLAAMRREMMHSLSRIKTDPLNYCALIKGTVQSLRPKSDLDLRIPVQKMELHSCVVLVERIFSELLLFSNLEQPSQKRKRYNDEDCSQIYEVCYRTWMGRRSQRRIVVKQQLCSDEWSIEAEVSKMIRNANEILEEPLCIRVFMALENEELLVSLSRLKGADVDLHNVSHFLSTFLFKCFCLCISESSFDQMEE